MTNRRLVMIHKLLTTPSAHVVTVSEVSSYSGLIEGFNEGVLACVRIEASGTDRMSCIACLALNFSILYCLWHCKVIVAPS